MLCSGGLPTFIVILPNYVTISRQTTNSFSKGMCNIVRYINICLFKTDFTEKDYLA